MKSNKHKTIAIAFAALLVAAFTGGCASKPLTPWQRAAFADYGMRSDRDTLSSSQIDHMTSSREAATGGAGIGGSGCGCN